MKKRNPLPNEHAARQTEPLYKTYRRSTYLKGKTLPKGISVIYGIREKPGSKGGKTEIQSIRFKKDLWSVKDSKKWLKEHKFGTKIEKARRNPTRRRNPYYDIRYSTNLFYAITEGNPSYLTRTIVYGKQGEHCDDCDELYHFCECEKCEECEYKRCLCDLDISKKSDFIGSMEDKYNIRKKAWEIAKNTLSKEDLDFLRKDISARIQGMFLNKELSDKERLSIQRLIS